MNYEFYTMILPVSIAEIARNLAISLSGESSRDLWTVPLYKDGIITHYISTGMVGDDMTPMLANPEAIAEASGGAITLEQAAYMFSIADISKDAPEAAIERLGLKLAIESEELQW